MLDMKLESTILPVAQNTQQMTNADITADEALLLALTGMTPQQLADAYAADEPGRADVPSGVMVPSVPMSCDSSV